MDNTIIAVVISALASIITTVWTARSSDAIQGEQIKNIQTEIEKLATKVEQHNSYGLEIVDLKARVGALEKGAKYARE